MAKVRTDNPAYAFFPKRRRHISATLPPCCGGGGPKLPNCIERWRDEDGALAELFEGVLTLNGVRYAWRASMFTDLL